MVILGGEHGVSDGGPDDDAFNLLPPVSGQIKNALVRGNPKVMRSLLGYTSASRAAGGGAKAFEDATKFLVANMLRSMHKRLEIELLYGQDNLGAVASIASNDITISDASWAPGIWSGSENMPIEIRSSAGVLRGTANISAADMSLKKISVDAMPIGVIASDVINFKGSYGNEFAGLHKIITNASSLFGIDASQFSLWKGNEYDAGSAPLSLEKIELAVARAVEKGLDGDVTCLVNPSVFSVLVADEAALRRYDGSYKQEAENGFSTLKFHAMNGLISVEPSIYCKQGFAYILNLKDMVRVGSSDVSFKRPGQKEEFFRDVENSAAYELRIWTDQALFTHAPGKNVVIKNITLS